MYLYDCAFIPITISYVMRPGRILNQIAFGVEKCRTYWYDKISFSISINKPKRNRPIGWTTRRQDDNIKMVLKLRFCDVNSIELSSDNATSNVTEKVNITFSSYCWDSKFRSQYKASLSCLRIFVVHKYSVHLMLNFGDIINNVNSIGVKQFVVSPEIFVYSHSREAMLGINCTFFSHQTSEPRIFFFFNF